MHCARRALLCNIANVISHQDVPPDAHGLGSALRKTVAGYAAFVMYKGSSALQRTRMANSGCEVWECFWKRAGSEHEAIL
jgi:hypothetical protein